MVEKSWVENFILVLGLNFLRLKLGVEKSGVEMSCNCRNNFCSPGTNDPYQYFFPAECIGCANGECLEPNECK